MLVLGRNEGDSVVLTDAAGREMVVTVSGVIRETGYVSLHLATHTNQFAVTLAPFCQLDLGETAEFNAAVGIANGCRGRLGSGVPRIQFHVPRDVSITRTELLGTRAAKAAN